MALTRRSVLGLGLAGAGLLAVAGVGVALRPTRAVAPSRPLKALSPQAFSVLVAVANRFCPGTQAFPRAQELGVAELIDNLLATSDPALTAELGQGLLLFDNALAGLLLNGRPSTFTTASEADQDAILEAWATSSLTVKRKVVKALRGLVAGAYYGHPDVYAACGYPGPPDFRALHSATPAPMEVPL